jgi:hypothetical protein
MTTTARFILAILLVSAAVGTADAQQSDFAITRGFDDQYRALSAAIENALSVAGLDSLRAEVDSCEVRYAKHEQLLDRYLYPETFAGRMKSLRTSHALTYDRVYLITTQGVRLEELETRIFTLTQRVDTLTAERTRLLAEIQTLKKSSTEYRDLVRRLQANILAKDRLILALIDTVFQRYNKDFTQGGDIQRESLTRQVEKANLLGRVDGVAADNLAFLETTTLQPKDYITLVEQYQQFASRWTALREKLVAASVAGTTGPAATGSRIGSPTRGTSSPGSLAATDQTAPAARVDSVLEAWGAKLQSVYWQGVEQEFVSRGVAVDPFHDAATFAASIRALVGRYAESGADPSLFVNDVWRNRIDKEWRESLVKPALLGAAEYAALDEMVGQLARPAIDTKFVVIIAIFLALVAGIWWFLARKPKKSPPARPTGT